MKNTIFYSFLVALSICTMAVVSSNCDKPAQAGAYGNYVPFSNYSAADGTAVKSSAINVRGFKTKTLTVTGIAVSGHTATSLAGTVLVECGPTSSGPWSTCVDNSYAQTAVSTTANGQRTWSDATAYIRASWAKTTGEVSAWLNWSE